MFSFESHWLEANLLLGAGHAYLVRLADGNTTMAQAQFATMRAALQAQQNSVQSCLTQQQVARGSQSCTRASASSGQRTPCRRALQMLRLRRRC